MTALEKATRANDRIYWVVGCGRKLKRRLVKKLCHDARHQSRRLLKTWSRDMANKLGVEL